MKIETPSALAVLAGAIAAAMLPPSDLKPSEWAAKNLYVVEGPRAGQLWDPTQTPYIPAIIDTIFAGPHTKGTVRKSAQTGFTQGLMAVEGWIACERPAVTLHVLPTTALARSYNREKLQPSIDASTQLRHRVRGVTKSREQGSNAQYKSFPGGSIIIIGANSASDLQMHTARFAICDEIDQWPSDLSDQGSPMSMVDARQISFHASRQYRKLQGGTPTLKGQSLVDKEFEAGDQRYLRLPCPHCGERIRLLFGGYADQQGGVGLRFNRQRPVDAHYVTQCCGVRVEHWQKDGMVDACASLPDGGFVAECPEPGRAPSWHIDTIASKFTTWDKLAEKFIDAGDDPNELKSFYNHWLGLPYEEKGDAPDWKILYQRREAYAERTIPADALLVTGGCDVQKRGLYVELVGWTADRRAYTLYAAYLPALHHDTSDETDPVWRHLTELIEQPLQTALGGTRPIDAFAIDCRYNAPVVYDWVRRHHGVYAVRTEEGWGRPILANPIKVDFDWRGKRVRQGVQQWKAGSYGIKSRFYAHLRRESAFEPDGSTLFPAGFCHFGSFLDDNYFKQLCDEYVGLDQKGHRIWKVRTGENHFLDCRVLNMAVAYGILGLERRTAEQWADLAAARGAPHDPTAPLLQPADRPAADPHTEASTPALVPADGGGSWSFNGGSWL